MIKREEIFEHVSEEYRYAAMDKNELWYLYGTIPVALEGCSAWTDCLTNFQFILLDVDYNGNWKDSLVKRGAKMTEIELVDIFDYIDEPDYFIADKHF